MFGYPGGSVIPIFDALLDSDIRFYLVRHEQAAAHAADGYARATGKVGVCIATSGPGATNLVTGIATANMDSIPIVAITGQVKTHLIGNDAFQEADVVGITRPITKYNYLVKDIRDLARVVREAFYLASSGRPGPVVIDVPVDLTLGKCDTTEAALVELPGYNPTLEGNHRQIERAAGAINEAKRPVILSGGGVILSGATDELREFARKGNIPVTTTLLGLGTFPETEPLALHMLGMHGAVYANYAVMNADLLIAVGMRFDDRVTGKVEAFAPNARIVHIDIDPTAISKNIRVEIPIVGDARRVLAKLNPLIESREREEWCAMIGEWKKKHPLSYDRASSALKPQFVVEEIYRLTKGEAIITTEVGQNQMWAAQYYQYTEPRTFLSSGGLGTMGYGFPAAIGAQVGRPDKVVVDIAGDGSIQKNIQELATAVHNKLPVKIAVLNNTWLGMGRQGQERCWYRRYAHTSLAGSPDFVKVAEAYGAVGLRVTKKEEVAPAIEKALSIDNVVLIDFVVEPEENVAPMVPAGEAIDRFELL